MSAHISYKVAQQTTPYAGQARIGRLASLPRIVDGALTQRTFDAFAINAVCNDPAVLPGLSLGAEQIDVSPLLTDERNIAFLGEFGGALFHRVGPGIYGAHDFFLVGGRGAWALSASREMLRTMFGRYGARMVFAETPVANRACRMFNRWLGFKSEGVTIAPLYAGAQPEKIETFVMEAGSCL